MKVNVYSGYYEKYVTPKKLGKGYNLDYTDELKYVVFDTEDEWNNDKNSEEAVVWDKDIMDDVIKYSSNPWMFEDEEPEEYENGYISYGNMFIFSDMTSIMAESKQISRKRNMYEANKVVPDENDFEKCPYCGSHNTDIRYDVDLDTPADVLAHATCKDCGKKYQGQFMFNGAYYGNGEKDYEPVDTCPLCGTKNYTETVQFDGNGYVDQDFKCKNCGVTWYNSFVWNDNPSVFECNCHKCHTNKSKSKKSSRKRHLIHESSNSDIIRKKIFDVGHRFGLDVYGTKYGGMVWRYRI